MNTVPISDELLSRYPGFRRIVVGSPTGNLIGDGETPEDAIAVEAVFGEFQGWPAYIVHERLEPEEAEALKNGALLRIMFMTQQMPVHSFDVVEGA